MDDIIIATNKLINVFEESKLISNLEFYKSRVILNKELLQLIDKYNNTEVTSEKISLKEKIYNYGDYTEYMKYYNELFFYVLKINKKFKEYTSLRRCHKCE